MEEIGIREYPIYAISAVKEVKQGDVIGLWLRDTDDPIIWP